MLFSVPQTVSIALGAALVTLIDYRIEIVVMGLVTLFAAAYLFTRTESESVEAVRTREPPAFPEPVG
jgi:uncharacterized membrane protein YfcA